MQVLQREDVRPDVVLIDEGIHEMVEGVMALMLVQVFAARHHVARVCGQELPLPPQALAIQVRVIPKKIRLLFFTFEFGG